MAASGKGVRPRLTTPLHAVIQNGGTLSKIEEVLTGPRHEEFKDPNAPDPRGYSPIHYLADTSASTTAHPRSSMISQISDLDTVQRTSDSENADHPVVKKLEKLCDFYNRNGHKRDSVLHLALKFKQCSLANRLIELGADASAKNNRGWYPLHSAGTQVVGLGSYDSKQFQKVLKVLIDRHPHLVQQAYEDEGLVKSPVKVAVENRCLDALLVFDKVGRKCSKSRYVTNNYVSTLLASLCSAASAQNPAQMKKFLDHACEYYKGALSEVCDLENHGQMPLHILAKLQPGEASKQYSAWLQSQQQKNDGNQFAQMSPVQECVKLLVNFEYYNENLEVLKRFLQMRSSSGDKLLDFCARNQNIEVGQTLLVALFDHRMFADIVDLETLRALYNCIPQAIVAVMDRELKNPHDCYTSTSKARVPSTDKKLGNENDCYSVIYHKNRMDSSCLYGVVNHTADVQKAILLHPLTKTYLKLRWTNREIFKAFIFVLFQFLVLLFYMFVITEYHDAIGGPFANTTRMDLAEESNQTFELGDRTPNWAQDEERELSDGNSFSNTKLVLCLLTVAVLLIKECFQFYLKPDAYYRNAYNIFQLLFGVVAVASLILILCSLSHGFWLWFLSVTGVLLACIVAMLQLRNIPAFGVRMAIIIKITKKSFIILIQLIPVFGAFFVIIRITIRQGIFSSLNWAGLFVKLFVMMIGELTFDEIMETPKTWDSTDWRLYAVLGVLASFAFLGTIVLFNLFVAMAVNVTEKVKGKAKTEIARCKLEQLRLSEALDVMLLWFRNKVGQHVSENSTEENRNIYNPQSPSPVGSSVSVQIPLMNVGSEHNPSDMEEHEL